jgi:hypothetical protein
MLFSAPVQDKQAKGNNSFLSDALTLEQINQSIRALLGNNSSPNGNVGKVQENPSLPQLPYKFSH